MGGAKEERFFNQGGKKNNKKPLESGLGVTVEKLCHN